MNTLVDENTAGRHFSTGVVFGEEELLREIRKEWNLGRDRNQWVIDLITEDWPYLARLLDRL